MLQNSILFIVLVLICYGCIILVEKKWGKAGLFGWIAIATIISNILAASIGPMCGFRGVTLANVPFATVFLANQVLTECYSEKDGKRGVNVGLFSATVFLGIMMLSSYLIPEDYDSVTSSINYLFSFGSYNMCNTVASVLMFYLANLANVYVFARIRKKTGKQKLWIANNVATIIANCCENFAFVFLGLFLFPNIVLQAFPSAFDVSNLMALRDCMQVAITTCIFEFALALFDTPVFYITKHIHDKRAVETA